MLRTRRLTSRPPSRANDERPRRGFGTFGGVFTPCTLTILGVIMFLRFGRVVGSSGLLWALVIVAVSKAITTLTALSLSAIATNTRVRGGGAYFLISRSLGVEPGASIGVLFYIAQAVSVAMYVLGFTEAFVASVPGTGLTFVAIATLVNVVVFVCVYIGAGWTIRLQYGILALLGLSLLSFFFGAASTFDVERLQSSLASSFSDGENFFTMFALFFPAATGIMAGANMSGDLANPSKAIPQGTLLSILITGLIYAAIAVVLSGAAPRADLLANSLVMKDIAAWGILITLGVFAATLSSALGSMMGAPRILQALARDEIFERLRFFGRGDGPNNEPRPAVVATFLISQVCIVLGDLNAIAPVITMFFMITYGYLNLATFYESVTRNPSYRPRFRFSHWSTALLGAIGCGVVMFLINPLWAAVAIIVLALLQYYVSRRDVITTWGDAQSGAAFERARRALLRLEKDAFHPKNWRPSIIAFSGGAWSRVHLAVYGYWLTASRGVLTLAQVISGDVDAHLERRRNQEAALRRFIADQDLRAFPAVLVAPTREAGMEALVQCHGMGALRPNLVLLGWSEDPSRTLDFARVVRNTTQMGRSVALLRESEAGRDPWQPPEGTVDVWWRGADNGHLMVLLAHMLVQSDAWRGRPIRLLRVVRDAAAIEESTKHLEDLLRTARIHASAEVIVSEDPLEAIHQASAGASVVFLGFIPPTRDEDAQWLERSQALLEGLGTAIFVWSTGDVRLEA